MGDDHDGKQHFHAGQHMALREGHQVELAREALSWGLDIGRVIERLRVRIKRDEQYLHSGQYARARHRVAWSKPVRQALYHCARASVQADAAARAYDERKQAEGQRHPVAVRALANRWVRMLDAMWGKRARYDPAIFLVAQQAHSGVRPVAAEGGASPV
jgi:hypothetical protein